jgi:hypothetical protein
MNRPEYCSCPESHPEGLYDLLWVDRKDVIEHRAHPLREVRRLAQNPLCHRLVKLLKLQGQKIGKAMPTIRCLWDVASVMVVFEIAFNFPDGRSAGLAMAFHAENN